MCEGGLVRECALERDYVNMPWLSQKIILIILYIICFFLYKLFGEEIDTKE